MGLSIKYNSVIEKIKERVKNEDLITESTDIYKPYIHPCLTSSQIEDIEKQLKVKMPPFVVQLYTEIGDGGFGRHMDF